MSQAHAGCALASNSPGPLPLCLLSAQVALAFKPEPSWAIVDGALQVMTPTPIGDRLETFRPDESTTDVDPDGNTFVKRSAWRGGRLVTTATGTSGEKPPFVTERWIDAATGKLRQVNTYDGVSMTRVFTRKVES